MGSQYEAGGGCCCPPDFSADSGEQGRAHTRRCTQYEADGTKRSCPNARGGSRCNCPSDGSSYNTGLPGAIH